MQYLTTPTGYVPCACRDCFEVAIGAPGKALCHECADATCEGGTERECSAPSAYDGAERVCKRCGLQHTNDHINDDGSTYCLDCVDAIQDGQPPRLPPQVS